MKITTARWYTPSGRSIARRLERDDTGLESPEPKEKKNYRTISGRTIYDGGGITPDVIEGDSAYTQQVREFQTVLGRKVSQFRDALTDYALSLKPSRSIRGPQFEVTPEMLDEYARIRDTLKSDAVRPDAGGGIGFVSPGMLRPRAGEKPA